MAVKEYREWIKAGLARPGKSQAGLARHMKVSQSVITRIVKGSRPLRVHEVERIESYFQTTAPKLGHIDPAAAASSNSAPLCEDNGLFYVRTWMKGSETPDETRFTNLEKASKFMDECSRDRAYVRIEFLEAREWMTRSVCKAPMAPPYFKMTPEE